MKLIIGIFVAMVMTLPLASAQERHDDDDRGRDRGYSQYGSQGRLSAEDQARFDSYYSRWMEARQNNNRQEVSSMEGRMREVMAHNSISPNTDFSQIASGSARRQHRRSIPRFSGDDARRFQSYYSRWQGYRQTNNGHEMASMEGRMREVMNRHDIPGDVSYDEVENMLNRRGR